MSTDVTLAKEIGGPSESPLEILDNNRNAWSYFGGFKYG
jgi:hypothetical protein